MDYILAKLKEYLLLFSMQKFTAAYLQTNRLLSQSVQAHFFTCISYLHTYIIHVISACLDRHSKLIRVILKKFKKPIC